MRAHGLPYTRADAARKEGVLFTASVLCDEARYGGRQVRMSWIQAFTVRECKKALFGNRDVRPAAPRRHACFD